MIWLSPEPLLRIYRSALSVEVWAKIMAYQGPAYAQTWSKTDFVSYAPGSALEGNLIHWMANHPYTPQRITGFELDPSYNDP
jgi:hypothetical protein